MNKPLVSICCITYNHEQFIAQAIEGIVMQQTNFDFEIVISNDCSTDATQTIINSYKIQYPHLFKDISPKKNLGMMANFKQTLEACTGKYIALCEGDDYWTDPLKLQKQVDFLEANEEFSFCCHNSIKIYENIKNKKEEHYLKIENDIIVTPVLFPEIKSIPTASFLFRNNQNVLSKYGEKVYAFKHGDFFLLCLLFEIGDGYFFKDTMACYRIHIGGVSSTKYFEDNYLLKVIDDLSNEFMLFDKSNVRDMILLIYVEHIVLYLKIAKNKNYKFVFFKILNIYKLVSFEDGELQNLVYFEIKKIMSFYRWRPILRFLFFMYHIKYFQKINCSFKELIYIYLVPNLYRKLLTFR